MAPTLVDGLLTTGLLGKSLALVQSPFLYLPSLNFPHFYLLQDSPEIVSFHLKCSVFPDQTNAKLAFQNTIPLSKLAPGSQALPPAQGGSSPSAFPLLPCCPRASVQRSRGCEWISKPSRNTATLFVPRCLSPHQNTFNSPFLAIWALSSKHLKTLPVPVLCPVPHPHRQVLVTAVPHDQYQFLSWSAEAAITKYHRLGSLYNRNLFLTILGAGKSKIKVLSQSVLFGEGSLADGCLPVPHMADKDRVSLPFPIRAVVPS